MMSETSLFSAVCATTENYVFEKSKYKILKPFSFDKDKLTTVNSLSSTRYFGINKTNKGQIFDFFLPINVQVL
jgi:hypothetical protein